ncbi:hypothetical protein KIPB_013473, partial [Kipferlia bialata]
ITPEVRAMVQSSLCFSNNAQKRIKSLDNIDINAPDTHPLVFIDPESPAPGGSGQGNGSAYDEDEAGAGGQGVQCQSA